MAGGGKYTDLEGGTRNVAFAAGGWLPDELRGRTTDEWLHVADIWATFASLAGDPQPTTDAKTAAWNAANPHAPCPEPDSVDASAVLREIGGRSGRTEVPLSLTALINATDGIKIVTEKAGGKNFFTSPEYPAYDSNNSAVPKEMGAACEPYCIFDVLEDPEERHDLADTARGKALAGPLQARLAELAATHFETGDTGFLGNYTNCTSVSAYKAAHRGFLGPLCYLGNGPAPNASRYALQHGGNASACLAPVSASEEALGRGAPVGVVPCTASAQRWTLRDTFVLWEGTKCLRPPPDDVKSGACRAEGLIAGRCTSVCPGFQLVGDQLQSTGCPGHCAVGAVLGRCSDGASHGWKAVDLAAIAAPPPRDPTIARELPAQSVRIEPWGQDAVRVRSNPTGAINLDAPGALGDSAPPMGGMGTPSALRCAVADDGRLQCFRGAELLLQEARVRSFTPTKYGGGVWALNASFVLAPGEKVWGLGQTVHNALDNSGRCLQTAPQNGHIVVPLVHSSRGYSLFFNLPSYGEVCIDGHRNATDPRPRLLRWYSRGAFNFDLWVTASAVDSPTPALQAALRRYVEATGKPTPMPAWVSGFWQSKNRYRSCSEVLGIAREYKRLGIPLSVMVIDEGSWDLLGNEEWGGCENGTVTAAGKPCPCFAPCAADMTAALAELGVEVMLSPYMQFVVEDSTAFAAGNTTRAFALGAPGTLDAGIPSRIGYSGYNRGNFESRRCVNASFYCGTSAMYDVFSPASGARMMERLTSTFYEKSGIKWWWLDCDEPCDYENRILAGDALLWRNGTWPDIAVGAQYPAMLNKAIFEHMHGVRGEPHVVTLARSAWAGSQRWGTTVWSGDTSSDWASLRNQISEGQAAGLSGLSYWPVRNLQQCIAQLWHASPHSCGVLGNFMTGRAISAGTRAWTCRTGEGLTWSFCCAGFSSARSRASCACTASAFRSTTTRRRARATRARRAGSASRRPARTTRCTPSRARIRPRSITRAQSSR